MTCPRRFLLLAAIASVSFQDLAAQTTTPKPTADNGEEWHEYIYPDDGFAITLPTEPHPHKDAQFEDGTAYTAHFPQVSLALHVGNFPKGCEAAFKEYLGYARRSVGDAGRSRIDAAGRIFRTDPNTVREFNIAEHPAVEYEQEITIDRQPFKDYELILGVGKKLYALTARWDEGPKPADLTRAIASFRLVAAK
jgi:hypothetical protein